MELADNRSQWTIIDTSHVQVFTRQDDVMMSLK